MGPPTIEVIRDAEVYVRCYAAMCTACSYQVWVFSGYAFYWVKDHTYKGGAGYSRGAYYCPRCVKDHYSARGPGTMRPMAFATQETYHAMHRLGGEQAVLHLMRQHNGEET